MALGAVPYKAVWVSGANDGNGIAIVTINITDNNGVVKASNVKVAYDFQTSLAEALVKALEAQMVIDGNKLTAAQAVVQGVRVGG
jgi:hypothetical protein